MDDHTPAMRAAVASGVDHRVVAFGRVASIEEAAAAQGLEVSQVCKTLVVRLEADSYVLLVVSGDRKASWPKLRAHLGRSRLTMPSADEAFDATGYERGTITPFGHEGGWPVLVDAAVMEHDTVTVGGGRHGTSIHLTPTALVAATGATVADVTDPAE